MSEGLDLARTVISLIGLFKKDNDDWQVRKIQQLQEIERQKRVGRLEIEGALDILRVEIDAKVKRKRELEERNTRDYKELLDSIDDMKSQMIKTFSGMPRPMALIIHHHAKQMLDDMWQNSDEQTRQVYRAKFTSFLKIVFEDTQQAITAPDTARIPEQTLKLLEAS